jgi:hypothetical protein
MVKTRKQTALRRCRRRQVKIGDFAETRISSAFLHDAEKFARNRASKIIFRAITLAQPRRAARAAPGGGAYTQN